jgi:hypothetical protein
MFFALSQMTFISLKNIQNFLLFSNTITTAVTKYPRTQQI